MAANTRTPRGHANNSISDQVPYLQPTDEHTVSEPEIDCRDKYQEKIKNINEVCCSIPGNCIPGEMPVLCSPKCAGLWTPFAEECPNYVAALEVSTGLALEDLSRACKGDTTYCEKQFTKLEKGSCSISSLCRGSADGGCSATGIPTTCPQGCADLWNLYSDTCSDYIKTDLSELVDFTKGCQYTADRVAQQQCQNTLVDLEERSKVCGGGGGIPKTCNVACAALWNPIVDSCGSDYINSIGGSDMEDFTKLCMQKSDPPMTRAPKDAGAPTPWPPSPPPPPPQEAPLLTEEECEKMLKPMASDIESACGGSGSVPTSCTPECAEVWNPFANKCASWVNMQAEETIEFSEQCRYLQGPR
jgi:hypothetical protein